MEIIRIMVVAFDEVEPAKYFVMLFPRNFLNTTEPARSYGPMERDAIVKALRENGIEESDAETLIERSKKDPQKCAVVVIKQS